MDINRKRTSYILNNNQRKQRSYQKQTSYIKTGLYKEKDEALKTFNSHKFRYLIKVLQHTSQTIQCTVLEIYSCIQKLVHFFKLS